MAATFQMLAVQHSTSKEIHTWHRPRPSRQRRPADSSLTRLSGITSAATSASDTAVEATKVCGTRWKARTRRMVTRTSRFHRNVAAISSTSSVTTSTVNTDKGGSRPGRATPPGPGLGPLLQASGPGASATPAAATETLAASMARDAAPRRGHAGSGAPGARACEGSPRALEGRQRSGPQSRFGSSAGAPGARKGSGTLGSPPGSARQPLPPLRAVPGATGCHPAGDPRASARGGGLRSGPHPRRAAPGRGARAAPGRGRAALGRRAAPGMGAGGCTGGGGGGGAGGCTGGTGYTGAGCTGGGGGLRWGGRAAESPPPMAGCTGAGGSGCTGRGGRRLHRGERAALGRRATLGMGGRRLHRGGGDGLRSRPQPWRAAPGRGWRAHGGGPRPRHCAGQAFRPPRGSSRLPPPAGRAAPGAGKAPSRAAAPPPPTPRTRPGAQRETEARAPPRAHPAASPGTLGPGRGFAVPARVDSGSGRPLLPGSSAEAREERARGCGSPPPTRQRAPPPRAPGGRGRTRNVSSFPAGSSQPRDSWTGFLSPLGQG
uniref:Uncharacterized protein n=1 Tax=Canis lupus familiaris TaxID=9615 RepID=A0A8C0NSU4_CANLF